jgi:DNA repair protein RadC
MPTKTELQERLAAAESMIASLRAADTKRVLGPHDVAEEIRKLAHEEQETFVVVFLNARQRVLKSEIVAMGSLSRVDVHPRDVFRTAIRLNAHSVIIGHNHPSNETDPSDEDISLTKRIADAGRILGIPLLDHVVVSATSHVSFAGLCLLPNASS